MQLTILTLNLAGYKDWAVREKKVIEALNQANADIVLLQEVRYNPSISPLTQANYANSLLDTPYAHSVSDVSRFYAPSVGEPYREGLAMLSRFPLHDPETLALAKAPDDKHTRMIQNVDVDINGTTLGLANVHFSNNQYSASQLEETLNILSMRDKVSIIAGDFNILDINTQRAGFDDKYSVSTDTTSYISFPIENATLDYILLPKAFHFVSIKTLEGISDHNGVLVVVEV
jgi:endonuclease/exonuclease/phosphatase family metal-dependent hydrolase